MDVLVRRAERSVGLEGTDAGSGLGSYFWSDTLGVCWDGREQGQHTSTAFNGLAANFDLI